MSSAAALGAETTQSIAQRNVVLYERAAHAINAREVPAGLLARGFSLESRVTAVTDDVYLGTEGWREWMGDLFDVFADGARYEVEEIIASGKDFVVAALCVAGRGARSGLPLAFRWVGVTWFRDEKLVRVIAYTDREQALRAVGLTD